MGRFITADIPGCGGTIKESPDDFQVTEIPLYLPCGEGEHLYVEVEKRGITTLELVRRLARSLKVSDRDMGYAGMKDAVGVTRQTVSIPRVAPESLSGLEIPGVRVLSARRHGNKLRLGHLAGNRFRIVVASTEEGCLERVRAILAILGERGVPNFFGPQRYGAQGNYPAVGRALLLGDHRGAVDAIMGDPDRVGDERWKRAITSYRQGDLEESLRSLPGYCGTERELLARLVSRPGLYDKALYALSPRLRKLYLSAYQSALFDRVLDGRLEGYDRVMDGDLAHKHDSGACFLVEDAAAEAGRAERFEISPTGPLFGCKMKQPLGVPLELEEKMLGEEGLTLERFNLPGGLRMEGERRPLRVPLGEPSASMDGDGLVLEFSLPRGAYATALLREVMKG